LANDLTKRPWLVDTVSSTTQITGRIKVKSIRWASITSVGDELIILDDAGTKIFQLTNPTAKNSLDVFLDAWWTNGFRVSTLGSGIVFIDYA